MKKKHRQNERIIVKYNNMKTIKIESDEIETAAGLLKKGEVVAFPTETVYGLGADATNATAVTKIFNAKGRAIDNPLIVHVGDRADLPIVTREVSTTAQKLMDTFWPGPLTLLLPKSSFIPDVTSAGLSTVGVRMPAHPVALALLKLSGPLAAPSANLSGKPSPTEYSHVVDDLEGKVAGIINGTGATYGIESTVFDPEKRMILRPGSITKEMIEAVIGEVTLDPYLEKQKEYLYNQEIKLERVDIPLSPGQKYKHYAPTARAYVVVGHKADIIKKIMTKAQSEKNIGVLATDETVELYKNSIDTVVLSMGSAKDNYSKLFSALRVFDKANVDKIYIEGIEEAGIGFSVMDRIIKATSYNVIR